MCTGAEIAMIASAVAGTAGTFMQQNAAQQQAERAAEARNQVLNNFLDKNKSLSEEARGLFEERISKQGEMEQQQTQGEAEAERAGAAEKAIETISDPLPISGSAPRVVKASAEESAENTRGESTERANALARARSFGDLIFENTLASNAAGRDVGMIQGFANSNASMLPHQQDLAELKARSKRSGLGTLGSILSAAGQAGSTAAGAGVFGGAPTAGPSQWGKVVNRSPYLPGGGPGLVM